MRNFITVMALSLCACGLSCAAENQPNETPQNTSVQPNQAQGSVDEKPAAKSVPKNPNAKPSAVPQAGQIVDPKMNNAKPATDPKQPGEKGASATPPPTDQPRMTETLKPTEGSQGPQLDRSSSSPRLLPGEQVDATPKIKSNPEELKQRTDMSSTKNDTEIKKENPIR